MFDTPANSCRAQLVALVGKDLVTDLFSDGSISEMDRAKLQFLKEVLRMRIESLTKTELCLHTICTAREEEGNKVSWFRSLPLSHFARLNL